MCISLLDIRNTVGESLEKGAYLTSIPRNVNEDGCEWWMTKDIRNENVEKYPCKWHTYMYICIYLCRLNWAENI